MTINVYLDSAPENQTDALALHAVRVDPITWNGWAVPIAIAAEFRRFVAAWAHNDPNGLWMPDKISEGITTVTYAGGASVERAALIYDDGAYEEPQVWPSCGTDENGAALYGLDGWVWLS